MELRNYLLELSLDKAEIKSFESSIDLLKKSFKQYLEKKVTKKKIDLTIIYRILEKDLEKNQSLIEILGFENFSFYLISSFISRQDYNTRLYTEKIQYNVEDNFFLLTNESKTKNLYGKLENLNGLTNNSIGNLFDPLTNFTMKGFFKNNFIDFDDLNEKNKEDNFRNLTGIIYKKNVLKKSIILKLVDFRNLIDIHKVYINFKDETQKELLSEKLKINQVVSFQNNIRQTISKKLKIVFSFNYDKYSDIKIKDIEETSFNKLKISERIKNNIKNTNLNFTELVNLQPYVFHRGIHKLLVECISVFYCCLKLYCKKCKKSSNDCFCEESNFSNLDVFCILLLKNSDLTFTATIKKTEHFYDFFDIDENQKLFIFDFLKNSGGSVTLKMKEYIDFKSQKAKLVKILHKLTKDKIILGKFKAKEQNENEKNQNFFLFKKGFIYPNGLINEFSDSITYKLDFIIKYVETKPNVVYEDKFNSLLKKMMF